MISLFLILISSTFSAVIERLNTRYFYRSVFRKLNPMFWNRKHSQHFCKSVYGYPLDAYFYLQIAKIICICLAIVLYAPITVPVVDFFLYTGVWAFNFDVFYSGILRDKK